MGNWGKRRILAVDDEPMYLRTLERQLGAMGYVALCSGSAKEALDLSDEADLILTDLRMPEMDGLELLKALREKGSSKPVIFLSGNLDIRDVNEYCEHGLKAYLMKGKKNMHESMDFAIRRSLRAVYPIDTRQGKMRHEVLVLDDDAAISRVVAHTLESGLYGPPAFENLPCVCHIAHTTEEAYRIVRQNRIALSLIDINLRGEKGTDILTHIKNNYPHMKRVIFSGTGSSSEYDAMLSIGSIHNYITKPANTDTIAEVADALIAQRNAGICQGMGAGSPKLVIMAGTHGVGKSTGADILYITHPYAQKIIPVTTRTLEEGRVNGEDKRHVRESTLEENLNNYFAVIDHPKGYRIAYEKGAIENAMEKGLDPVVCTTTLDGLFALTGYARKIGVDTLIVYVKTDPDTLLKRTESRSSLAERTYESGFLAGIEEEFCMTLQKELSPVAYVHNTPPSLESYSMQKWDTFKELECLVRNAANTILLHTRRPNPF